MTLQGKQEKYAIHVAEREEYEKDDADDRWYHAFLLLISKSKGDVTIRQQLHYFYNHKLDSLYPCVLEGISDPHYIPDRFEGLMTSSVYEGNQVDALNKWNNLLKYAFLIKACAIPFEEDYKRSLTGTNCRAAVRDTLSSVHIQTTRDDFAQEAGLQCEGILNLTRNFQQLEFSSDVDKLKAENERRKLMIMEGTVYENRYIGPLQTPLLPMKKMPS